MKGCWVFFHKYTKWKDEVVAMVMINNRNNTKTDYQEERQSRVCEKCGKKQIRKPYY